MLLSKVEETVGAKPALLFRGVPNRPSGDFEKVLQRYRFLSDLLVKASEPEESPNPFAHYPKLLLLYDMDVRSCRKVARIFHQGNKLVNLNGLTNAGEYRPIALSRACARTPFEEDYRCGDEWDFE